MADIESTGALRAGYAAAYQSVSSASAQASFAQAMQQAVERTQQVHFSRHAAERMSERNLTLADDGMQKLSSAVDAAASSGQRDSLVLMQGLAFIVDVPGRTVVTAMPVADAQNSVFTHIDGAVIA